MHRAFLTLIVLGAAIFFVGCSLTQKEDSVTSKPKSDGDVNVAFLLSMDFREASAISAKRCSVPPFVQVAADEIEVLRTDAQGRAKKVRAKGHVFVQLDYKTQVRALCQEALVSDEDIILRGSPLLQRGQSTIEGVSDFTVFYLLGERLRAIGPHKVSNAANAARAAPLLAAWQGGPNPLLPPLEASAVPEPVREEMKKAAEAEEALQKSRSGQPMAFPEALEKPVPVP